MSSSSSVSGRPNQFLQLALDFLGAGQHFVIELQRGLGLAFFDCPRERKLRAFMGQGAQPDGRLFGPELDVRSVAEIAAALGHDAPDRSNQVALAPVVGAAQVNERFVWKGDVQLGMLAPVF